MTPGARAERSASPVSHAAACVTPRESPHCPARLRQCPCSLRLRPRRWGALGRSHCSFCTVSVGVSVSAAAKGVEGGDGGSAPFG